MDFIVDRNSLHLRRLKYLRSKGWANMTAAEQSEYAGIAAKGAYNYTDLNRVETAVALVSGALCLGLITKTDWTQTDVPTRSDMERYLGNIDFLRYLCRDMYVANIPNTMNGLDYDDANRIERVAKLAYDYIQKEYIRSGEVYAGEV